jgi:hypothetical protein
MALKPCPDCGHEVSERAPTCPKCGAPLRADSVVDPATVHGRGEGLFMKSMNCGCMVALGFAVLSVVMVAAILSTSGEGGEDGLRVEQHGYFKDAANNRIFSFAISSDATEAQVREHAGGRQHTAGRLTAAYYYTEGTRIPAAELSTARDLVAANDLLYDHPGADVWRFAWVKSPDLEQFVNCETTPQNDLCRRR